jgi:hypothetical protein
VPGIEGAHPAHDTVTKRYRHLNFFQHECHLEVRVPRVRLPDGGIRQVEPDWAGRLAGFTGRPRVLARRISAFCVSGLRVRHASRLRRLLPSRRAGSRRSNAPSFPVRRKVAVATC